MKGGGYPVKLMLFVLVVFLSGFTDDNNGIPSEITGSLNNGNSRILSRYFHNSIELVILDAEDVYSKSQAELIMRNFFASNKPEKFELLHWGGKESSRYAIGNLITENNRYRVSFMLKDIEGEMLMHLLRIESVEN